MSALDDASLDGAAGKTRIVISELPYQTNKAAFVQRVAELVDEGVLTGIADVRDESDRSGTRVVVELRRGVSARVVLGSLYKQTPLQVRGRRSCFGLFFPFFREDKKNPSKKTLKNQIPKKPKFHRPASPATWSPSSTAPLARCPCGRCCSSSSSSGRQ